MLPGPSFYQQGGGGLSARALIDGGAAVALASDFNPATSPTYNMQLIIALACARQCMTPAEAICAATINAACAIGYEDRAGSLEVGKPADLILLNAPDYREIPYHFGVNLVRTTMKRGVVIYQQGKVDVTHRPVQRDL
jgi:imidazolonepropionase